MAPLFLEGKLLAVSAVFSGFKAMFFHRQGSALSLLQEGNAKKMKNIGERKWGKGVKDT